MTGHASLDVQGSEAVLTVDISDEPYGLLTIAPSSQRVATEERDRTINIYVNREFGASGLKSKCNDKDVQKVNSSEIILFLCLN